MGDTVMNVSVPEGLHWRTKSLAARQGMWLKDAVAEALEQWCAKAEHEQKQAAEVEAATQQWRQR